jgi:hypothetical protein
MATKIASKPDTTHPLSLGASRNLQKLIENDFSTLSEHLAQYATDRLTEAEEKVKAKWATKGIDINSFVDRATELDRKHEDAKRALIREASEAGIQLEKSNYAGWHADSAGLKEAVKAAQKTIRANQAKAVSELTIQQKAAERRVLLATVTGEAEGLLQSLPTAAQLMAKVAKVKSLTA